VREERLARHAAETDPAVVLAAAGRLLEVRSRTVSDLRTRLLRSGFPAPLVVAAIDRLVELGLLDDAAFARGWLEARDRGRPRGERVLRTELRLRGVPADLAAAALEERRVAAAAALDEGPDSTPGPESHGRAGDAPDDAADEVAATRLLDRRASALRRVPDARQRRQRAYALLARNGFDPDVSARVAARFMSHSAAQPESELFVDD
jgi:SOS response regulatory protein OraA/RecX